MNPLVSKTMNCKYAFVRATNWDATAAIPRTISLLQSRKLNVFVFCWNRSGKSVSPIDGVNVSVFNGTPGGSLFLKVLRNIIYQIWLFRVLLENKPNYVQFFDFQSALPCLIYKLISRCTLIYDQRDPFAVCYNFSSLMRRFVYAFDWVFMCFSDYIVVPDESRLAYLGRWRGSKKTLVVYNTCPDLGELSKQCLKNKKDSNLVYVAYVGFISATRAGLFLANYASSNPDKVLLTVAGTCDVAEINLMAESGSFIRTLGRIPSEECLELMATSDVVAILYDPSVPVNRLAAPNKFYEAMSLGTPVVVSDGMLLSECVNKYGLGWVIPYADSSAFDGFVNDLLQSGENVEMRNRCREFYLKFCSYEKYVADYNEFFDLVLSKSEYSSS